MHIGSNLHIHGLNPGDKRWTRVDRGQDAAVAMVQDVRTATISAGEPSGGLPRRRHP